MLASARLWSSSALGAIIHISASILSFFFFCSFHGFFSCCTLAFSFPDFSPSIWSLSAHAAAQFHRVDLYFGTQIRGWHNQKNVAFIPPFFPWFPLCCLKVHISFYVHHLGWAPRFRARWYFSCWSFYSFIPISCLVIYMCFFFPFFDKCIRSSPWPKLSLCS